MGIAARRDGLELQGSEMEITKVMSADAPRRIARVELEMKMLTDRELSETDRAKLIRAAHTCPVALSLHPDLVQAVTFSWNVGQEV